MKKILLANAWHDDNLGDRVLVLSALKLIQNHYPESKIDILSSISESSQIWPTAHIKVQEEHPNSFVIPSIFPISTADLWKRPIGYVAAIFVALLSLVFPSCFLLSKQYKLISQYDAVISVGGHDLFSNGGTSFIRLVCLTHVYFAAIWARKPVTLLGQSIGPFPDYLSRRLMKRLMSKTKCIFREQLSLDYCQKLTDSKNGVLAPDTAFYVPRMGYSVSEQVLTNEPYAVITVRKPLHGNLDTVETNYLSAVKNVIEKVIEEKVVEKVVVFPHTIGPLPREDDNAISMKLCQLVNNDSVIFLKNDFSLTKTLGLYKQAEFVLGTRLHSVIFAITQGTPGIAIGYSGPKAQGIMRMLDMGSLCFHIDDIDADKMVKEIKSAICDENKSKLAANLTKMMDKLEGTTLF